MGPVLNKIMVICDSLLEIDSNDGETVGIYYLTKSGEDMPLPQMPNNNRQKGWQRKAEWRETQRKHGRRNGCT